MKQKIMFGMFATLFLLVVIIVNAQTPPTPRTITGWILNNDSSGAENGIPVIIINENISQTFYTEVYAPVAPLAGIYSDTINGSTGDNLTVRAYNDTHYGESQVLVSSTTTRVNITMNITRNAETNVTITYPQDDGVFASDELFNLTVNVSVLGANGLNCNVTINISNESIVSLNSGTSYTNTIGSINLGQTFTSYFELIGNNSGRTNISVYSQCSNQNVILENLDFDTIYNIRVADEQAPFINIVGPGNLTVNKSTNQIDFVFNVSDASTVTNCTLNFWNKINDTLTPVTKDTNINFSYYLDNGQYYWNINCTDEFFNNGSSWTYILNVSVFNPIVTFATDIPTVILNAGSTKKVECNLTVQDGNGASDIFGVNATFYSTTSNSQASDNNNTHYTNSTCVNTGASGDLANYTCQFRPYYYAVNGTWYCNATAVDLQNLVESNQTNTTIDTLYALNVSKDIIDYGDAQAGSYTSDESFNITNLGNQPINVSVRGYGGQVEASGFGTAMLCDSGENISIANQRFALLPGINFFAKTPLSSINQDMALSILKQSSPGIQIRNETFWQLYVSTPELGPCNGTIRLTATAG